MSKLEQIKAANQKVNHLEKVHVAISGIQKHTELTGVSFPSDRLGGSDIKVDIPAFARLKIKQEIIGALRKIETQILAEIEATEI